MRISSLPFRNFAKRYLFGAPQQKLLAAIVLILLGVGVWSQRIGQSRGFLLDDPSYLKASFDDRLSKFYRYLPGIVAHRPIGRHATILFLRVFGERDQPIIWTSLFIHLASAVLLWLAVYRLTANWWASLAGATFFLLNVSVYLAVYWPAAIFDLLSTFFLAGLFLSICLIVQPRNKYHAWRLLLTLPLLVAAIKTKESAIVASVPLFLVVLLSNPEGHEIDSERSRFTIRQVIQRLRNVSKWEVAWLLLSVALLAVLVKSTTSSFGAKSPADAYYSEYSPQMIGRSFGFYLTILAFRTHSITPLRWSLGLALTLVPFAFALLLRNRWLLYGWVWFVIFLLALATLKNHYAYYYYPYPAALGAGIFIAGFFVECEKLWSRWRPLRFLRFALPVLFILLVGERSYTWFKTDGVPRWYDQMHARSTLIRRSLKRALPLPPHDAEIVLVIPEYSQFVQNPTLVLEIIYNDPTLTGILFREPQAAERFLAESTSDCRLLAVWNGNAFELTGLSQRQDNPP
jgi:hypothetical protein